MVIAYWVSGVSISTGLQIGKADFPTLEALAITRQYTITSEAFKTDTHMKLEVERTSWPSASRKTGIAKI